MKKNRKGFTLIELLAVVIVLIVIIFIAVNKINESTKKAKKNSIRANAISYIKLLKDKAGEDVIDTEKLDSGIFSVDDLKNLGIKLSGKEPDSGYVLISDYKVISYCLVYNSYKVTDIDNEDKGISKGTCSTSSLLDESLGFFTFQYSYIGSNYQTFTAPVDATYYIELWGASGFNNDLSGKGAYTSGFVNLNKDDTLYIYVGQGNSGAAASFNGGGSCRTYCYPGGGATDVRLVSGNWNDTTSLASRIMVAGGGGGYNTYSSGAAGGYAGGLTGKSGTGRTADVGPYGGTQTSGGDKNNTNTGDNAGFSGKFGIGGNAGAYGGGGGGGYYGGGGGSNSPSTGGGETGGAGGSSYISGYTGCVAIKSANNITPKDGCSDGTTDNSCSIHYSGYTFFNGVMKSGNETMPKYNGTGTMTGNSGNGFAKITVVSTEYKYLSNENEVYSYKGFSEVFSAPKNGYYKIELWGASGGNNNSTSGLGGYTSGKIKLNKGEKLYIYVGGKGSSTSAGVSEYIQGGYNGGGDTNGQNCCGRTYGSGGGATDVRYFTTTPSKANLEVNSSLGLASRIMVAAGGGGGFNGSGGGNAGGLNGLNATTNNGYGPGNGATQLNGGINTMDQGANGSFAKGGSGGNSGLSTGGGGGFYGGSGSHHIDAAGGGSSYISGYTGCVAIKSATDITPKNGCTNGTTDNSCSIHYSNKVFINPIMIVGNESMPTFDGSSTMTGNLGNGYAKITYIGESIEP